MRIFLLSCLLILCNTQVIDSPRPQPLELSSLLSSSYDCCQYITNTTSSNYINDNYKDLLTCSLSKSKVLNTASSIKIVSYYTDSISQYAAYSVAINLAWSHHHQYQYSLLSPDTGHEFDNNDQRWNKVMILLHSIDTEAKKYCRGNVNVCAKSAGWAKVSIITITATIKS